MLKEEKIRLMTKLARYESGEGKEELRIARYYRSDYIGLALIKNFFLITIAYILILAIGVGYFAEELLDNVNKMNLVGIGVGLIVVYLILLVLYSLVIYAIYSVKYSQAKKSVKKYYVQLGKIAQMYVENDVDTIPQTESRRKK